MTAFATSDDFLDRVDNFFIDQVAAPAGGGGPDTARITTALDDATAQLEGWLARVPDDRRPDAAKLLADCVVVALYLLTLNRPPADFEGIKAAYDDTIAFYRDLAAEASGGPAASGASSRPSPVFDDDSLEGFV